MLRFWSSGALILLMIVVDYDAIYFREIQRIAKLMLSRRNLR